VSTPWRRRPSFRAGIAIAVALLVVGLFGRLSLAWGYGLLIVSGALLVAGLVAFALLLFGRRFETEGLVRTSVRLLGSGAWVYLFAVSALAGYFVAETLAGRVGLRGILFGPAVLAALIVLDVGLYRVIVARNLPTWRRYRAYISRRMSDPGALRRALIDDVILQRTLFSVSRFRWFRHVLIFWGFMLLFGAELLAVVVREALPAFGWPGPWTSGHPVRLAFDFAFDLFGSMVFLGCVLALAWRVAVRGTEQRKYADTPTAAFLLAVVLSGFLVEALRIAASPGEPYAAVSFVGYALAAFVPHSKALYAAAYEPLWLVHVLGSCLFIAYVPVKRLVHACAVPIGRLVTSQTALLEAKRQAILGGLMRRGPAANHGAATAERLAEPAPRLPRGG